MTKQQSNEPNAKPRLPLHRWCDPEQQDFINALNGMARAASEYDEDAYDAAYSIVEDMLEKYSDELSQRAGFHP